MSLLPYAYVLPHFCSEQIRRQRHVFLGHAVDNARGYMTLNLSLNCGCDGTPRPLTGMLEKPALTGMT